MKNETNLILAEAPLGKKSSYVNTYSPSLLFPLPRKPKRDEIEISDQLPFIGFDIWTGYEVSWLNEVGKPMLAIAEFTIPCESRCLIESKSFKLYLNSFNNSKFKSIEEVASIMKVDLSKAAESPVNVRLFNMKDAVKSIAIFDGFCLDDLNIECTEYQPNSNYLQVDRQFLVEEIVYTDLLKSNCLVTGQPDWGSVQIIYKGMKINKEGLLKYIVSLRDHNEFHEQCVERIFMDIKKRCNPIELTVYARYTRRGGLDINPFRTTLKKLPVINNIRLVRQ